jgi:hypothetical protein
MIASGAKQLAEPCNKHEQTLHPEMKLLRKQVLLLAKCQLALLGPLYNLLCPSVP